MFIDLVDVLRCPNRHEEWPLVAAVTAMEGRYVRHGTLGCPACRATFTIRDFVAWFAAPQGGDGGRPPASTTEDQLMRLAALADLQSPGGYVAVTASLAAAAGPLAMAHDVQCVVLDPSGQAPPAEGVSVICAPHQHVLASGALRALVVGPGDEGILADAPSMLRAVRAGARIVAPASCDVPAGVRELARDADQWVGERQGDASPIVVLGRR